MSEGQEKICPLFSSGNLAADYSFVECKKEQCAWWVNYSEVSSKEGGNCAIRDIAAELITSRLNQEFEYERQARLAARKAYWDR